VVKKWLTPWIVASFVRITRLVEGHGTSARIDFGDVPTMTGQMMWSDRLLRNRSSGTPCVWSQACVHVRQPRWPNRLYGPPSLTLPISQICARRLSPVKAELDFDLDIGRRRTMALVFLAFHAAAIEHAEISVARLHTARHPLAVTTILVC